MEISGLPLDLTKVCRTCLCEDSQMFSIYSELYEEENCEENLPCLNEIITSLSSMKIQSGDNLPETICIKCVENAHISYKFQKCCNRSQIILEAYLNQCRDECNIVDATPTDKSTDNFTCISENPLDRDRTTLVLNENDLDLAENYIKESLIEEAKHIEVQNDTLLNPDEFFASDTECLGISPNPDSTEKFNSEATTGNSATHLKNVDEEGIGSMKNYEKMLPSGQKFFACKMCDKFYKNGSSLRAHIKGHHKKKKPYKCDICSKSFSMYGSYFCHKRTHTGEQPHSCKICGNKYKQSGSLIAHMRIHTGQKPFLCSICGKGFRQQPDLNYHMRTHTKEKPYQCTVCGKTMTMQSHLVQHMRIHTGERPFKCSFSQCEKTFLSSTCLKRHEIIHTEKKPYVCEVCKKSFNRSSSLSMHSKMHTDERPHVCHICDKRFIQAHNLKTHLNTHCSEAAKQPGQQSSEKC